MNGGVRLSTFSSLFFVLLDGKRALGEGMSKKGGRWKRTEEKDLIRVAVDEARDRRVTSFGERVETELWVFWADPGAHRDELTEQWVGKGMLPVDEAEDVRGQADGHGGFADPVGDVLYQLSFVDGLGGRRAWRRRRGRWNFIRERGAHEGKELGGGLDSVVHLDS